MLLPNGSLIVCQYWIPIRIRVKRVVKQLINGDRDIHSAILIYLNHYLWNVFWKIFIRNTYFIFKFCCVIYSEIPEYKNTKYKYITQTLHNLYWSKSLSLILVINMTIAELLEIANGQRNWQVRILSGK